MDRTGECNGCSMCCRFLILQVNPAYMDQERRRWIELHGIRLFEQDGGVWARITAACTHLTEEGQCGIYAERPQACREFPMVQTDIAIVNEFAGSEVCSYSFTESSPAREGTLVTGRN